MTAGSLCCVPGNAVCRWNKTALKRTLEGLRGCPFSKLWQSLATAKNSIVNITKFAPLLLWASSVCTAGIESALGIAMNTAACGNWSKTTILLVRADQHIGGLA